MIDNEITFIESMIGQRQESIIVDFHYSTLSITIKRLTTTHTKNALCV